MTNVVAAGTIVVCLDKKVQLEALNSDYQRRFTVASGEALYCAEAYAMTGDGSVFTLNIADDVIAGDSRIVRVSTAVQESLLTIFSRAHAYGGGDVITGRDRDYVADLFSDPAALPPEPHGAYARRVAAQVFRCPASVMTLEDYAAACGVSARTVQRQFTASTGMSFTQWRTAVRVGLAAQYLAHGFSVAVTADMVGFSATSSLARAFHRQVGCSPSDFAHGGVLIPQRRTALTDTSVWYADELDRDITLLVVSGSATLTAGDYCRFATAGETITLLKGTATRVDVAAASSVLILPGGVDAAQVGDVHNAASSHDKPTNWIKTPQLLAPYLAQWMQLSHAADSALPQVIDGSVTDVLVEPGVPVS